jgi:putative copper export protein
MDALWEGVRWLHLLAMAFFVGGQLFLVVAVVPVLRGEAERERVRAVARRFGWGTLVAIGVLLVTGVAMASHFHDWGRSTLHVKLALVVVVAGLVAWHIRRPALHALDAAIFVVSLAIVWLGVALGR